MPAGATTAQSGASTDGERPAKRVKGSVIGGALNPRTLHWVFKVPDRAETMKFYRDVLGARVMRHEEFKEGCEASCNGPYDGQWSKTMVAYGPEDDYFAFELTYNYGLRRYEYKQDFRMIEIKSTAAYRAATAALPGGVAAPAAAAAAPADPADPKGGNGSGAAVQVCAPGGYPFRVVDADVAAGADPVQRLVLASSDLGRSKAYWAGVLGMEVVCDSPSELALRWAPGQVVVAFVPTDGGAPVEHGTAAGRVAFSVNAAALPAVQEKVLAAGHAVVKELVTLPTEGKADVVVVILGDPDGYEICFVGDEAYRELSAPDAASEADLDARIAADDSDDWHAKVAARKARTAARKAEAAAAGAAAGEAAPGGVEPGP